MPSPELDGKYQISSTSNYEGPLRRRSDGQTEIKQGQTFRTDENKVQWHSTFTILDENEVEMVSVADPREANKDFALIRPDGSPSLEPVTYKTILKLSRKGDRIQMSGRIEYGDEIVLLTLRKISG